MRAHCVLLTFLVERVASQQFGLVIADMQLDRDVLMLVDSTTTWQELFALSFSLQANTSGAVTVLDVDQEHYYINILDNMNWAGKTVQWAGRRCLVWVGVVGSGQLQRALALLDSTVVEQGDLVLPGLWDRGNWIVFQVTEPGAVDSILQHRHAGRHPHSVTAERRGPDRWLVTPSSSSSRDRALVRGITGDILLSLLQADTKLSGRRFTVGCLPYSHHARAGLTRQRGDGGLDYSDWWGYEPDMVTLLGARAGFTVEYRPPEDGQWGALQEDTGRMSGLVGQVGSFAPFLAEQRGVQAAYGEVDWVMSGVMETRDRWRVADNPASFDSDYMVFVAPPPREVTKATAPLRPFSILVWCAAVGSVLAFSLALALLARVCALTRHQRGRPVQQQDWRLATSVWFAFSTFIGESVMRYEGGVQSGAMRLAVGTWYLYSLVATASYAGEIRSFFINPGQTAPLDNLGEVLDSGLAWGLILYGEEEEQFLAAATDPVLATVWQDKEEVPLDETYAVLERVAAGQFVFIDYKNGVIPQIEIKYRLGERKLLHLASHRWTKFSGVGWYFNKFFPHTEQFQRFIRRSVESGLIEAWKRRTWAGMRAEHGMEASHVQRELQAGAKVGPLVLDDVQGSFFFLCLGLSLSLVLHLIMVVLTKLFNQQSFFGSKI